MWSFAELQRWLDNNYPMLRIKQWPAGDWSIIQLIPTIQIAELPPWFEMESMAWIEYGKTEILRVRNRLLGGWVCDEIVKRDPKLWRNEGNQYHEGFQESFKAHYEKQQRDHHWKQSALEAWEVVRRNEGLMNRIAAKMERGDIDGAAREVTLESMFHAAMKENPTELRRKDFWKAQ